MQALHWRDRKGQWTKTRTIRLKKTRSPKLRMMPNRNRNRVNSNHQEHHRAVTKWNTSQDIASDLSSSKIQWTLQQLSKNQNKRKTTFNDIFFEPHLNSMNNLIIKNESTAKLCHISSSLFFIFTFFLIWVCLFLSILSKLLGWPLNFLYSLEVEKLPEFIFEFLFHVLTCCELFQALIFCMKCSIYIILVICACTLTVHLLIVIEEVGVHFVQEPLLPRYCHLHGDKEWAWYPVDESSSWPLIRERKMKELERLEEWPESIDKPMFILFSNASLHKWKSLSNNSSRLTPRLK